MDDATLTLSNGLGSLFQIIGMKELLVFCSAMLIIIGLKVVDRDKILLLIVILLIGFLLSVKHKVYKCIKRSDDNEDDDQESENPLNISDEEFDKKYGVKTNS